MQSSNKIVKDNNKYVISLDPGLEGALCLYNLTTDKVIEVLNTPTYKKDKKTWLHGKNIYTKLQEWSLLTNKVIIETQTIMSGRDGTKSAKTTMKNFGMLLGILSTLDFEIIEVEPRVWQSIVLKNVIDPGLPLKLKPTKRKSMVLTRDFNPKNDGQADAIAIALYYKTLLTKN
jgi:hypothetical protein